MVLGAVMALACIGLVFARRGYAAGYGTNMVKFTSQANLVELGLSRIEVDELVSLYDRRRETDEAVIYSIEPVDSMLWNVIPRIPVHIQVDFDEHGKVASVKVYDG
ncbi:MAG: hypothetical protein KF858_09840 [Candidatus Sumerlaeia bacterium]|nr:hypothetical protein [Candidatus Sumerlaeia bacterium]